MDGIDIVSRVRQAGTRRGGTSVTRRGEKGFAEQNQEVCAEMGLPLHAEKRLVGAASGPILGAEVYGERGSVRHGLKKGT